MPDHSEVAPVAIDYTAKADHACPELLRTSGRLLVRRFPLDDDEFTSFARHFGVLEAVSPPAFRAPGRPHIRIQSNVPGVGVQGGGEYWHSDGPWTDPPSSATLLLCFEAPARGGQTLFVDMRRALLSLQEADRIAITGRFGIYPCREIYLRELEAMGLEDHERVLRLKELRHPLVRRHPETGEPALYLNEKWLTSIDGVPIEQGSALLGRLYNTATGASVTYAHNWNVGDLLIWDNASTMHKALPTEQGAKTTHRITIAGIPGPFTEV